MRNGGCRIENVDSVLSLPSSAVKLKVGILPTALQELERDPFKIVGVGRQWYLYSNLCHVRM